MTVPRTIADRFSQSMLKDPRVRIEFNEKNSGSTFKQWNKGVRLASGEYVWIAESDDYADERLLERLVPLLDAEPTAVLAYCRSWRILADGQITDSWIPTTRIWIRNGGQRIFGLTGAKNVRTILSNATQSQMRVRCFSGGKCMCEWVVRTKTWSFAAIGNYGQRWLLREGLHT